MQGQAPRPINLLITADYELFLGRNFFGHDEVLFGPAEQLMARCEGLGVGVTFFADVCSVWAHRRFGLSDYADQFETQMQEAVKRGHDVQLHLHPHWLNSTWCEDRWQVATDRMYLAEFGFSSDEEAAPAIIKRGVDYLHDLLRPETPEYRCAAFRAAGLALQPDERKLIAALLKLGIKIDSSIAKELVLDLDTIAIDYRRMPGAANWYLAPDCGIAQDAGAGLLEIPIATFKCGLLSRLGFLSRRLRSVRMRRGAGISRSSEQTRWSNLSTMLRYNLRYLYGNPLFSLSCDTKGHNLDMLLNGFGKYLRQHSDSSPIYVAMINHPKLMFDAQFDMLESFVSAARSRYGDALDFVTTTDVIRQIDGEN
ncbi:MAG: hypothetical protein OEV49_01170 [candidate division Zixibacteria bacterium]|nr:hypothetical protein [candidate division Zixibacteria bacterium]MDH3937199.1 hypothetical protein [candidate division Zixibacteria bacterium]